MSCPQEISGTPFPLHRPEITIAPSPEPLFEVDFRELAWWLAVPEVGDHTLWAIYDPPEWKLKSYIDEMKALRPAVVHGVDGVEIAFVEHVVGEEEAYPQKVFGRLTERRVQWLATMLLLDGKTKLNTLLDEGFDEDWGESQRLIRHTGRFLEQPDGSFHQCADRLVVGESIEGMDVCQVTVGSRSFTCLRVIDVQHDLPESGTLMEAYLNRDGRTILCRRYNGRLWRGGCGSTEKRPWNEEFPTHNRIVIDGVTFVHWYDNLSGLACGIDR